MKSKIIKMLKMNFETVLACDAIAPQVHYNSKELVGVRHDRALPAGSEWGKIAAFSQTTFDCSGPGSAFAGTLIIHHHQMWT